MIFEGPRSTRRLHWLEWLPLVLLISWVAIRALI
jgi:hypothetical protein